MAIGIIGGSGVYELEGIKEIARLRVETPFGEPSSEIKKCVMDSEEFYFLGRHGKGHKFNPSEVNYRANIFALKKVGVKYLISVSAVGSLKEEIKPGNIVLPDQFIDWSKGLRKKTFFENGVVGHVSAAEPIEKKLLERIYAQKNNVNADFHLGGTYICIEGPQFSTRAESHLFKSMGGSIIGMTIVPEAYLAKEAGMAYATVALVTDYDCWKEQSCSVEEILKTLRENIFHAKNLLKFVVPDLSKDPINYQPANQNVIVSDKSLLSPGLVEMLSVILH